MSYQLTLARPRDAAPLACDEVQAYFDAHPRYQVGSREAVYANDWTGVVFAFRWGAPRAEAEAAGSRDEEGCAAPVGGAGSVEAGSGGEAASSEGDEGTEFTPSVRFELAVLRPRIFALEAAPELEAFAAGLGLAVREPASAGGATGRFSRAGFLRSWEGANRRRYEALLGEEPAALRAFLPRAEHERCWRWNLGKEALEARFAGEAGRGAGGAVPTVPPIVYVAHAGAVRSACLWTDAEPFVLPRVEVVILHRLRLARRRFFLFKTQSLAVVPYEAVVGALGPEASARLDAPQHLIPAPSPALVQLFRTAPALGRQLDVVPAHQVHDRETLEAALGVVRKTP